MAILKVANVHHDASGYTRTQISTANTIFWFTSNQEQANLTSSGVLNIRNTINSGNVLVNGVPVANVANAYAATIGAASNTLAIAAFTKANSALPNGNVTIEGTLHVKHNLSFDTTETTKLLEPFANSIAIITTGVQRAIVSNTGNVGIGTNNPRESLDVQGRINTTGIMVNSLPAYALANIRYFTDTTPNTAYTPPVGCRAIYVEIVGGGGGGGSCNGVGGSCGAGARGGGGGGYTALLIANTNQVFKYTVGTGGAGAVAGVSGEVQGSAGSPTYFYGGGSGATVLLAIGGGSGGLFMKATTTGDLISDDGGSGGISWGADGSVVIPGEPGGGGMRGTVFSMMVGGRGGKSYLSLPTAGAQQSGTGQATGTDGIGFGSGGGGGAVVDSTGNPSGGAGQAGVVKITEYY